MKKLNDFYNEYSLIKECLQTIKEGKDPIKLPYTFDIYNEGPKNKDYKITKSNIYKIFFSIDKSENFEREDGVKVVTFVDHHNQMIILPLPANKITYKEIPTKESTKNWTEIPEIIETTMAGAWYSDKFVEYNYNKYNKDWNNWFNMIKPYMKGKISVTIDEIKKEDDKYLVFKINHNQFNKDREDKIQELKDPKHLQEWAKEADAKEKAEIKKREEEEIERKKAAEKWDNWWNGLSDDEKLSWSMGYGKDKYQGD